MGCIGNIHIDVYRKLLVNVNYINFLKIKLKIIVTVMT